MEKETLEEAAKSYSEYNYANREPYLKELYASKIGFIDGANWQAQQMYSEEEVRRIALRAFFIISNNTTKLEDFDFFFEKFKK